jgi:hypothetical protein
MTYGAAAVLLRAVGPGRPACLVSWLFIEEITPGNDICTGTAVSPLVCRGFSMQRRSCLPGFGEPNPGGMGLPIEPPTDNSKNTNLVTGNYTAGNRWIVGQREPFGVARLDRSVEANGRIGYDISCYLSLGAMEPASCILHAFGFAQLGKVDRGPSIRAPDNAETRARRRIQALGAGSIQRPEKRTIPKLWSTAPSIMEITPVIVRAGQQYRWCISQLTGTPGACNFQRPLGVPRQQPLFLRPLWAGPWLTVRLPNDKGGKRSGPPRSQGLQHGQSGQPAQQRAFEPL